MCHINKLELQAIKKTLYTFKAQITGKSILVHCNNITVIAYMNKMGGQNPRLNQVMHKIFTFTHTHEIHLITQHLPGTTNMHTDKLSQLLPQHKWQVLPSVFKVLQQKWGPHTIYHMATKQNTLLLHFNSRFWEPHRGHQHTDPELVKQQQLGHTPTGTHAHGHATPASTQRPHHSPGTSVGQQGMVPGAAQAVQQATAAATTPSPLIPSSSMAPEPLQCSNWHMAIFRTSGRATPGAGNQKPWQCSTLHWPLLHGVTTIA
jgi:hypothetical protein